MRFKHYSDGSQGRAVRRLLLVMSFVMAAVATGLLAQVVATFRAGYLEARPTYASGEPLLLTAVQEPFWFYGVVAAMVLLSLMLLAIASRMWLPPPG